MKRLQDLLRIEFPVFQAPMAGSQLHELALATSEAGGLGCLPCALLSPAQAREQLGLLRAGTRKPIAVNFFSHQPPQPDAAREAAWKQLLKPYYVELGVDFDAPTPVSSRQPFDLAACELVEAFRPEVVSFHFGLPAPELLARVKATGACILSSATTPAEARWLAARGVDGVIAQGAEAGGHRGVFLGEEVDTQMGLFSLLPQIVDAVDVPVIAAGGIAEPRAVHAAMALGASAVQVGTAYLFTPEARPTPAHRAALASDAAEVTALTRLFSGRPARSIVNRLMRELGAMNPVAPAFPLAGGALMPLRAVADGDFGQLWSGQSARLARRDLDAAGLTRWFGEAALAATAPQ
ncbi:MAG: nitronate monooxygenase [Paucibacter sp.]|nr:nitronate monooxygenase [Roseateles sp.]